MQHPPTTDGQGNENPRSVRAKTVIVTGAASGIGRATAELFANEGAMVGALDVSAEAVEQLAASHPTMIGVGCDVSVAEDVTAAVDATREAFGPIDILVNNAGVSIATPIESPDFDEGWAKTLAVNLTGYTRLIRACLGDLQKSSAARIINIASTEALGGTGYISAYTASKHGVVGLTKSLAVELGPSAITVNAVCPGPINTGMTAEIPDEAKAKFGRRVTALRRYGQPHEVADVVVSIALPSASYLTGAVIPVDGGMTARNQ